MKKSNPLNQLPTLDLHGVRVDEVDDLVDRFIVKCNARSDARARIIHGKGTGKVKAKVLEYLKKAHYVPVAENDGSVMIVL